MKESSVYKYKYHFGVPNEMIWGSHIIMGIFFVYVGYELIMKRKLPIYVSLIVVVLGALGLLYHIHLWYEGYANSNGS
jgi:hypothetical protein